MYNAIYLLPTMLNTYYQQKNFGIILVHKKFTTSTLKKKEEKKNWSLDKNQSVGVWRSESSKHDSACSKSFTT